MTCIQLLRGETRTQVGRVVLHLKIRHDKGIDERPDLVGELIKREQINSITKKKSNTKRTQQRQKEISTRHDKGIDERPDLVGELIKRETNQQYDKEVVKHKENTTKTKRTKDRA